MNDPRETLTRIREQADNATEGPWAATRNARLMPHVITENEEFCAQYGPELYDSQGFFSKVDTEFIAAARTTVPALLDALEKVLDTHSPDYTYPDCPKCAECSDLASTAARRFAVLWPCETVEAITTALDAIK